MQKTVKKVENKKVEIVTEVTLTKDEFLEVHAHTLTEMMDKLDICPESGMGRCIIDVIGIAVVKTACELFDNVESDDKED